ncbi:hypothetical protein EDC96DRAFT_550401 [Choanephora cucurbitarum]|nr:hypothetical protein EDC96DRAFT_550401 [Choanephora cucurbitarum]
MHPHHKSFLRFFETKRDKKQIISFEDYLNKHKKYVIQFLNNDAKNEFALWYSMFLQSAKDARVKVVVNRKTKSNSLTLNMREKLVICNDHGPTSIHLEEWTIDGVDMRKKIIAKRTEVVKSVEQEKPIKESDYLLLSCVVYLPSSSGSFVLEVENKIFRRLRKETIKLPSFQFRIDVMADFFRFKQLKKKCKKIKYDEGMALVAVARRFMENKNWAQSITEEGFIDQHLLPVVEVLFTHDPDFVYSRSTGRIPLSDSSLSASKGKDTCKMLKPDFCIMHEYQGEKVGLLAIEVKLPSATSSQSLSDRSKLGLELKRLIDQQVAQGSFEPRSFGVLIEGFECILFSCTLHESGCYLFSEVEKLWLPRSGNDMVLVPDLVRAFLRFKFAMVEAISKLHKKPRSEAQSSMKALQRLGKAVLVALSRDHKEKLRKQCRARAVRSKVNCPGVEVMICAHAVCEQAGYRDK